MSLHPQIASQLGPTGQMTVKLEEVADFVADAMGIPASIRTTMEERMQMQQVMAEQAQIMAQQQQVQHAQPPQQPPPQEEQ